VRVELRVLDRLRDLRRDRHEQLDLVVAEHARLLRAHVQRAGEPLPSEDRHGENGLVGLLVQVRKGLEALVEVRLGRDHDRRALESGRAGDSLARPHPGAPGHLLDVRAVRRPQHELVGALVVEVDEARVRLQRRRDLARDERENLLEVERRVDRRDRFGQQAEVSFTGVHHGILRAAGIGPGTPNPVWLAVLKGRLTNSLRPARVLFTRPR
jgi:hypothetical protein